MGVRGEITATHRAARVASDIVHIVPLGLIPVVSESCVDRILRSAVFWLLGKSLGW